MDILIPDAGGKTGAIYSIRSLYKGFLEKLGSKKTMATHSGAFAPQNGLPIRFRVWKPHLPAAFAHSIVQIPL